MLKSTRHALFTNDVGNLVKSRQGCDAQYIIHCNLLEQRLEPATAFHIVSQLLFFSPIFPTYEIC